MKKINFNGPVITLGSPYGIGYEIFLLCIEKKIFKRDMPVAVGSEKIILLFEKLLNINRSFKTLNAGDLKNLKNSQGLNYDFILINIDDFDYCFRNISDIKPLIDGKCAYETIRLAAELVKKEIFKSIVTLPVSKENINLIDRSFCGHTEFFQKMWNEKNVYMTFISDKINILLLSTHIPLKKAASSLTPKKILNALENSVRLAEKLKFKKPVCFLGLNPHAGENGLIGKEELWIKKIILKFNETSSIKIAGPVPADTAFTMHNIGKYDLFISGYHDQGLIPFKMLSFNDGVNLSFGMKHIRTSVDHGTGVDLIGRKKANIQSFINAYRLALKLTE